MMEDEKFYLKREIEDFKMNIQRIENLVLLVGMNGTYSDIEQLKRTNKRLEDCASFLELQVGFNKKCEVLK